MPNTKSFIKIPNRTLILTISLKLYVKGGLPNYVAWQWSSIQRLTCMSVSLKCVDFWVFYQNVLHFSVERFFLNLSERQVHLITRIKKNLNIPALTYSQNVACFVRGNMKACR